jgi:alanyl-tRNA synthetase
MTSSELRERFLAYFERQAHRRVASHSLVPPADPSLLFVNAGMVQFKDVFVGMRKTEYRRATSSQKCLRVSGKHNDLENVGRTARHHTFFEMLGNFSFGDYFKKDAIGYAYEFLVHEVGLDPDRMTYTIFGGDRDEGLEADVEAERLWMEAAGVGRERILRFGRKDNFWAMGDTGPCGPCSEIIYDRGPGPWGCGRPDCAPGCDCDRFMEIWNLVFMQYERKEPGGPLQPLPAPSIDTGMGLERLAALVQEKPTNYETDAFFPLIERTVALLEERTGRKADYFAGGEDTVAFRVIADHARAAAFLIADGVYPDNEGRGYITRLLMRRAVRFGKKLGFQEPFFATVCERVVDMMAGPYPELISKRELIRKVVTVEEESFNRTFEEGLRILEDELARLKKKDLQETVNAQFLFRLHDERGLQPDLVEMLALERGFSVDRKGYFELMEKKRLASAKVDRGGDGKEAELHRLLLETLAPTRFVGYDEDDAHATVVALVRGAEIVPALASGEEGEALLDVSPFYGESGGQVGDTGTLSGPWGRALVLDTRRIPGDLSLHRVRVEEGTLARSAGVLAKVDGTRRAGIAAHHSGTHLLHWALNEVLGSHVKQEGSLVRPDLLRFDFRHFSPLTPEEIAKIEALVAAKVLEDQPVTVELKAVEEAVATGAKAFFGEKYGETVRLVSMAGGDSKELCGGTHVRSAGRIGLLKIVKQEAVSSGIRRVYALCHLAYVANAAQMERRLRDCAAALKAAPEELESRIQRLLERNEALEKEVAGLERKLLAGTSTSSGDRLVIEEAGPLKLALAHLGDTDDAKIRSMSDLLRDKIGTGVVLVGGVKQGKLVFVIARTKGAETFHCGKAVGRLAACVQGKGGGKPDFGQAGGGDPALWDDAVGQFKELVRNSGT